jgi:hypothetical protein
MRRPVETLETPPERPPVTQARGGLLVARRQVILPDHEHAVAVLEEHLGQEAVLERDDAVVPGITASQLHNGRHRVPAPATPASTPPRSGWRPGPQGQWRWLPGPPRPWSAPARCRRGRASAAAAGAARSAPDDLVFTGRQSWQSTALQGVRVLIPGRPVPRIETIVLITGGCGPGRASLPALR